MIDGERCRGLQLRENFGASAAPIGEAQHPGQTQGGSRHLGRAGTGKAVRDRNLALSRPRVEPGQLLTLPEFLRAWRRIRTGRDDEGKAEAKSLREDGGRGRRHLHRRRPSRLGSSVGRRGAARGLPEIPKSREYILRFFKIGTPTK